MDKVDRRAFLTGSVAAAATLAAWPAARALGSSVALSPTVERVAVVDRGVAGNVAFAVAARAQGLELFEFTSDVAQVWMSELTPRLRSGPLEILGHTSPATAFCLEVLARDYGADAVRPLGASTWLMATSPTRRAPLTPLRKQQG